MRDLAPLMAAGNTEWRTPRALFATLHARHDFTLDAAASAANAQLPRFYTVADNALLRDWSKDRVWLNPPYGRAMGEWMEKAATSGTLVVVLVPARTDTVWWHEWVMGRATQVAFVRGRLRFDGARAGAPFPSAVVTYAPGVRRKKSIAISVDGAVL